MLHLTWPGEPWPGRLAVCRLMHHLSHSWPPSRLFCFRSPQMWPDWPNRYINTVYFLSLPQENRESDDDIFNWLKRKDVYSEWGQEFVLLQGNCICQSSRSYTEPDNLTIGKSWEMEFGVRPHALFGIIKFSGSAENVDKVRIKGRKCLFAVLRSPGGDMRWGDIPAEWEIVGQQKNMMDNVQRFYNSVSDAGMTYCLGKKHTRWQIQNLLMNTNGCECLNSIMKEKLRTRKTRQCKNINV